MFKKALMAFTALAAMVATGTAALAEDNYPSKPVRLVLGFAVGGPTDVIARVLAKDLTISLGQSFIVDTRPGANSMIATEMVSRSPADGYTLLVSTLAHNVNAIIAADKIKYDPFKHFAPVNLLATVPMIAVTSYEAPYRSLRDIVEAARKDPEGVTYGSAGNGGSAHLAGSKAVQASLKNPATAEQLRKLGAVNAGLGPEEFAKWARDDYARWERVIKAAGIRSD